METKVWSNNSFSKIFSVIFVLFQYCLLSSISYSKFNRFFTVFLCEKEDFSIFCCQDTVFCLVTLLKLPAFFNLYCFLFFSLIFDMLLSSPLISNSSKRRPPILSLYLCIFKLITFSILGCILLQSSLIIN